MRKLFFVIIAGSTLILGGCAISPKPFTGQQLSDIAHQDRQASFAGMEPLTGPLTLQEAIARALKYNLDHRVRMLEQAMAVGQLDASRYDMLPRLLANAGYSSRDEENIRRATDSVTGAPSLANPYISNERSHVTSDIGLTWNVLDFGASYYSAKQNADRVLAAAERRRKAMHLLTQNVRSAFWRAASAEKLRADVKTTITLAEAALADSTRIEAERIKTPAEALRYQRTLLENIRLLEAIDRELASARIELASLVGLAPNADYHIAEPKGELAALPNLTIPVERMEELAIENNADLREQFYTTRIAALETRRSLLKLFPGLSFDYAYKHDDDRYLVNQSWQEAGIQVSLNLLNLLSAPSQMRLAKQNVELAEARRVALQMAVLTQTHLARQLYEDAALQYRRADAIWQVDSRLAELSHNQAQSQMTSQLDRVSTGTAAILSLLRRYQALAKAQEAASKIQAIMGLDPQIGSLDSESLSELTRHIEQTLRSWTGGEALAPADQSGEAPLPVSPPTVRSSFECSGCPLS